jgi:hypothetical protein
LRPVCFWIASRVALSRFIHAAVILPPGLPPDGLVSGGISQDTDGEKPNNSSVNSMAQH